MSDYRIKSGDTLSRIARSHHTSVSALQKANHLKDPNKIQAGAKLNIPGSKDEFESKGAKGSHKKHAHGHHKTEGSGKSGGKSGGAQAGGKTGGTNATQGSTPTGPAPKGQVGDWIKQAQQILSANGVPADKMNAQQIAAIIQHESSGNPNAINNWDSNAKAGHPSIGLMQTIQPTFNAYKLPGHDNIRNPVDNIIAGVRYSIARYGSISNVPGIKAMEKGGGYVGY
jgi:LysM repeat protein